MMSHWQSPATLYAKGDHRGQRTRMKRGRLRRRRPFGPIVMLLEQKTLLATATITTLNLSTSSLVYGQTETFTATVKTNPPSGTPPTGGVVSFMEGPITLGTGALSAGIATASTTKLSTGSDVVTAVYRGTGTFAASHSGVTSTSIINTVAGGGAPANRQALYTPLSDPEAVAIDSSGNLFIADSNDNVVDEVNASTGTVTIVAGGGTATPSKIGKLGYLGDGGLATAATLSFPEGLAVEGSGTDENLFIADTFDNVIREVDLGTGIIQTIAGNYTASYKSLDLTPPPPPPAPPPPPPPTPPNSWNGASGVATSTLLYAPIGIALDRSGNLFIADSYNNVIREVVESTTTATALGVPVGEMITVAGNYGKGNGGYGGDGGPATATTAALDGPSGVAVDKDGNIFIADTYNNVIREVVESTISPIPRKVPVGDITAYAGNHSGGSPTPSGGTPTSPGGGSGDGGPALDAKLHFPQGIFVAASGDLYFADTFNSAIREVNLQTGIISGVVGNGTEGDSGDGGSANNAEVAQPFGVTLDGAGNIFIADTDNDAIRKVSVSTGVITTVAGGDASGYSSNNGPANASELTDPTSTAVDGSNNIFIADTSNNAVREVNAQTGQVTTVAGGNQPVYHNPLSGPADVAMDSTGDLFIADTDNNEVDEVNLATGTEIIVAGDGTAGDTGDGKLATDTELDSPEGVAVDGIGHLFIADTLNNEIREVNLNSGILTTIAGDGTAGYTPSTSGVSATAAELNNPIGVALDNFGDLFIADSGNNLIEEIEPGAHGLGDGNILTYAGEYNDGLGGYSGDGQLATGAQLNGPQGIAVGPTGNVFIADSDNNRIREVNGKTHVITTVAGDGTAGSTGDTITGVATDAELNDPIGVAAAGAGEILVADSGNDVVREVNLGSGMISPLAGDGGFGNGGDGGLATAAQLSLPQGLALVGSNLFIADSGNNVIREVTGTGVITTVVGGNDGLLYTNNKGAATAATLASPDGIAVDSHGNIFVADEKFNVIREVVESTSAATALGVAVGDIVTIAGNGTQGSIGDLGPATDAELNDPAGLAFDGSGNLFIADSGNNVIREVVESSGAASALGVAIGDIATVAGDGASGYSGDGEPATDAELSEPTGVSVNSSGNIVIADSGNNVIREVSGGVINTIAGDGKAGYIGDGGAATAAELWDPTDVALNGSGDLFIADSGNNVIREVTSGPEGLADGTITTVAGTGPPTGSSGFSGDGGQAGSALLAGPTAVAADSSGDIYIADAENNVVREVSIGQTVTVAKAPLTFTASALSMAYGAKVPTLTYAISGLVNGDTSSVVSGAPIVTTTATSSSHVAGSPYPITITAGTLSAANYSYSTFVNNTLTITPVPLKITANNASKVYGAMVPVLTASYSGFVNVDTPASLTKLPTLNTTATKSSPAQVVGYLISAFGAVDHDYTTTYVDGALQVTPAPLTITADNASKLVGEVAKLAGTSFTESGLVNGDTVTSVNLMSAGAAAKAPEGTYPIVPSAAVGTGLSNYTISYLNGTLAVVNATLAIKRPLATVESVKIEKVKTGKHTTKEVIVVQFSEAFDVGVAQNSNNYSLFTIPKSKKQKSKAVPFKSPSYSASALTVTLTTRKVLVLSPPLKLTIVAAGPSDSTGLPLASNVAVKLTTGGASISRAAPLAAARGLPAHVVDAVLSTGFRPRTRHSRP